MQVSGFSLSEQTVTVPYFSAFSEGTELSAQLYVTEGYFSHH